MTLAWAAGALIVGGATFVQGLAGFGVGLAGVVALLVGTVVGMPLGVWALASFPAPVLKRLIGALLLVAVGLEVRGVCMTFLRGPRWALGAGLLAGILGGGIGAPAPPAILYAANQGWSPRTVKANLQVFFFVNQTTILAGYWWAGLLGQHVWTPALAFAVPGVVGLFVGMRLFARVDHVRFRRIVFALIFVSGLVMLVGG